MVYLIIYYPKLECPAEFRVTEFRRNYAEFFPGIPPELSYGIPYFLRNSVCMRNSVFYGIPYFYGIPRNTEFRIPLIQNFYGIPPEFRIPYHEFRQTKFRRNFFWRNNGHSSRIWPNWWRVKYIDRWFSKVDLFYLYPGFFTLTFGNKLTSKLLVTNTRSAPLQGIAQSARWNMICQRLSG